MHGHLNVNFIIDIFVISIVIAIVQLARTGHIAVASWALL
jgi:hypothetical protein